MGKTRQNMVPTAQHERMVPQDDTSSIVDQIAVQIFVKTYGTPGKTVEHLIESSYSAAEQFIQFGESRS